MIKPGIYQHYKGGYYHILGSGKHTETGEEFVFYRGEDGTMWHRPLKMFEEDVTYTETTTGDTKRGPRFKFLLGINMYQIPVREMVDMALNPKGDAA